eukprot:gene52137-63735_t
MTQETSMPPHSSRRTVLRTLTTLTVAMSGVLTAHPALAQTEASIASAWRATSRLGYGPTPASAQAALADPRAWALQQIDAAYNASRTAPYIPQDLARFNQPLNDIARDFRAEREAR